MKYKIATMSHKTEKMRKSELWEMKLQLWDKNWNWEKLVLGYKIANVKNFRHNCDSQLRNKVSIVR